MQIRESFLTGMVREKATTARNALSDIANMLSEVPENTELYAEVDNAMIFVERVLAKIK